MLVAHFVSLEHEPGIVVRKSGFRNNSFNERYYGGGNGTFIVPLVERETILTVKTQDEEQYEFDVYSVLKDFSRGHLFTKKYINSVAIKLKNETFVLDDNCTVILNIEEILERIL